MSTIRQSSAYIALARSLPPRLLTFFARYPPASIVSPSSNNTTIASPAVSPDPASAATTAAASDPPHISSPSPLTGTSQDPRQTPKNSAKAPITLAPQGAAAPALPQTLYQAERPNPFVPWKNPETGHWRPPLYSMRRQAELVKLARTHGVEELLPATPKGTESRIKRRVWLGLRVKGTGEGQKVKGHKFERERVKKMEKKREAAKEMYGLVKRWRKVGAYRWQEFPK